MHSNNLPCCFQASSNPWRSLGSPHADSKATATNNVATWAQTLKFVYLQPLGDTVVAASTCLGAHALLQVSCGTYFAVLYCNRTYVCFSQVVAVAAAIRQL